MMIQSDPTSRRKFLTGMSGAALSLPWFESLSAAAADDKPATRLAFFYLPNGLIRRGFFPGESDAELPKFANQNNVWRFENKTAPVGSHNLTFTPTLASLHKMREKIALITGMDRTFQNGTDSHAQAASCYLTNAAPYEVPNSVYPLSRTLDHVAADSIGQATPFQTLELSCNDAKDNIESIYFDNMSWYGPGHVAPSMRNPRKIYDRLFSTDSNARYRNITDLVLGNANSLQKKLGAEDKDKFGEYFEAIRSIENRMDRMDELKSEIQEYAPERPRDFFPRNEYIHLMGDLMITALQSGLTNVSTLMIAAERWTTTNKYEGILDEPRSHHGMTHNQGKFVDDLLKLDSFHVSAFARMAEKMDSIVESDGTTLLDNTIFTLGAGLGDGATHQYNDLPVIVAGGGGGRLKLGKHIHCERGTPLANLWLTQLHALGANHDRFADSTETLTSILA
ncbi:MAG: hypothetical protein ACI8UO_002754 [Verrucomicrobiales bacterium]|jgi:hypothetical protein